ncbi:MAG: DUF3006 domain-containing protein [Gemmatimonadota bacterium]|nr:DUF3006 domain-containing protein [Gemmatimonadota bacterium]
MRTQALFVVDRREGDVFVLVDEKGASIDVRRADLSPECQREGAVIRVPIDDEGRHAWKSAARDEELEGGRTKEAEAILARLRKKDRGGDISL